MLRYILYVAIIIDRYNAPAVFVIKSNLLHELNVRHLTGNICGGSYLKLAISVLIKKRLTRSV